MKFNDNVLVKQAIFGLYGDEVKNQAKFWIVRNLISGDEIPVQLNDCFEAYADFDEVFADEFVKAPNWPALWNLLNSYDEEDDRLLAVPRIAGSVLARFIDEEKNRELQDWIQMVVDDQRMADIILDKARNVPEMLEWSLIYFKKFAIFRDSPALIVLIKDIALQHPKFVKEALGLIIYLGRHRSLQHGLVRLIAMKAMAEIYAHVEPDERQKGELLEKIDDFSGNMDAVELHIFLQEDTYLPYAFRIRLSQRILNMADETVSDIDFGREVYRIFQEGLVKCPDEEGLVGAWLDFVLRLTRKHPEYVYELFLMLNSSIDDYVRVHGWEVALMNWNPGMNFQNYSAEFRKLALTSLDLANLSGHFRPRAFLTALNIWVFDVDGKYDAAWFEQYVDAMPQNADNDSCWDDDLSQLFEHLAMLYRYRTEIQKQNADFLAEQAKVFVKRLMSNYALMPNQIEQLKALCVRLELDIDIAAEVRMMKLRLEQIARKKEQERQYLLALFT